jgi:hypothetical protein
MVLVITLEEILEYIVLFSTPNQELAAHVVKYGSDEEQFIKWNERLQHCVAELKLQLDAFDVFNGMTDLNAFQKDLAFLRDKNEMFKILKLLHGKNKRPVDDSLDTLLDRQSHSRSTYQSRTAASEPLQIDPKKVKYQTVIGRGGKLGFMYRVRRRVEGDI